jgi:DNA-binding NarL/FixJ family response regulator
MKVVAGGTRAGASDAYEIPDQKPSDDISSRLGRSKVFAVVDGRRLERECFIRAIELLHPNYVIIGFPTIDACRTTSGTSIRPDAIIYNIGSRLAEDPIVSVDLKRLVAQAAGTPVVVLAETEELNQVLAALDCGIRGYIPASVGIDAIMEATTLASVGGVFLTSECLAVFRTTLAPRPAAIVDDLSDQLTSRQSAVAEALRRGKPNKIIAYELNMCESTVKVHIRTILKKLGASNRTEAAFKLNAIRESLNHAPDGA